MSIYTEKMEKLHQLLTNKLREKFGDAISDILVHNDKNPEMSEITVVMDRSVVTEALTFLRDDPSFQFNFLSYLTAVDYLAMGRDVRFDVVYHLLSLTKAHRIRVRVPVPEDDPTINSVVGIWGTADFHERETYDMFGLIFQGHPDLRRILMPDDWEGHPLRKDFPLGGVKSFYFKRATNPHAGEPPNLVPRIRVQQSDI
ncbi:MAG: NADH-quinone oxidoreductase subunit C [Sumerlaeia bacterium]